MDKSGLRRLVRQRKGEYSEARLREMSARTVARLLQHPRVRAAHTLMLYHSLPDEVYTHDLIDRLMAEGKTVVLPAVTGEGEMEARRADGGMREGAYHIMEPAGEPFTALGEIEVAVVPGMAYDRDGHRLGRGKGYYDRFLPRLTGAYRIGVCFGFQIVERVPTEAHDMTVDEVIA